MQNPEISILIAAYNHEEYVAETIESILAQDFEDWELIIVDDASTDDTPVICSEFVAKDPKRIRLIRGEQNQGVSLTGNRALAAARGQYHVFCSSDDRLKPGRLTRQLAFMQEHPWVGASFGLVDYIDAASSPLPTGEGGIFAKPIDNLRLQLLEGNFLHANTCMVRNEVFESVGDLNPALRFTQDYDLWTRILDRFEIVRIEEPLVDYRIHGKNLGIARQDFSPFGMHYETLIVASRATERWEVERVFGSFDQTIGCTREEYIALGKIEMARRLVACERVRVGVPLVAAGRAYSLVLDALALAPGNKEVAEAMQMVYEFLGDRPRSRGHDSIDSRLWRIGWGGSNRNPVSPAKDPGSYDPGRTLDDKMTYARWKEIVTMTKAEAGIRAERMMLRWQRPFAIHVLVVLEPGLEELLGQTIESLDSQLYKGWGLSILALTDRPEEALFAGRTIEWIKVEDAEHYAAVLNQAIRNTAGDWVLLMDPGDRLAPEALVSLGDYGNLMSSCRVIYTDDDVIDGAGVRRSPRFKPDLNIEMLRATPYMGRSCFLKREALEAVGGLRPMPGAEVYDAILRIFERYGEPAIGHVPEVLYHVRDVHESFYSQETVIVNGRKVVAGHLSRIGITAAIDSDSFLAGSWFIDYQHEVQPLVSIVIPTRDRSIALRPCIESILTNTRYPHYEVVIVDNGSHEAHALDYLDSLDVGRSRVRVARCAESLGLSRIYNFAAREARGEYLVFFNEDSQIVQGVWLDRMMAHALRPEVGVVGARVVSLDKRLRDSGVVLGMAGAADQLHKGLPMRETGYLGRAQLPQNFSAVTGGCMLTRRSLYEEVGGMDADNFEDRHADVDYCLSVGARGYKVVWTPYATVLYHGSRSEKDQPNSSGGGCESADAALLEKWLPCLANDPAFNPNLSLAHRDAQIETDIVPGWNPPFKDRPRILGFPLSSGGTGHYRLIEPLRAARDAELLQIAVLPDASKTRLPQVVELARIAPDAILFQCIVSKALEEGLQRYRKFLPGLRLIFEIDDLLTEVPAYNPRGNFFSADFGKRLSKILALCDCMTVSTEPLREAFGHLIGDVRVVPNRLPRDRWVGHRPERGIGPRPRVGWAGAQQHRGDLMLLREVVSATAHEVDWVFFGMCPQELRPFIREFHECVPLERYPATLARLNLDLAVAPLETNRFNEAKSNLRILEYGAMGWPVVCTDIEPYQAYNAPVMRVPNNTKAWIEAVRSHAHDLDSSALAGDRLRQWVLDGWILEDHLDGWLSALVGRQDSLPQRQTA